MKGYTFFRIVFIVGIFSMIAGCSEPERKTITIHLIGDSTMSDKPDPANNPERGWGQMLVQCFDDHVTVSNHAMNGRSTKRFIDEGRWITVLDEIEPGDYVFIQFGHNDRKVTDPERFVNPWSAYRRNLERFVKESRETGANPVLLSSISRRSFNEQGVLTDSHGPYTFITREVAEDLNVPFIDLQLKTEDLLIALGPERSKSLFMNLGPGEFEMYPEGLTDNTHLRVKGATEIARLATEGIRELDLPLAEYLVPELKDPRILLVTGGHSYDTAVFYRTFNDMEGFHFDSVSQPYARQFFKSDYISGYDLIIFYDFCRNIPKKDSAIYRNLANRGVNMLFLHHALATFQDWDGYKKIVGGKYIDPEFTGDPAEASGYRHDVDIPVRVVDKNHPVTEGIEDFTILDEVYSNIEIQDGVKPLLTANHPECSDTIAWVHGFDRSTTVYILFGHDRSAFENSSFQKLVYNTIEWLTGGE